MINYNFSNSFVTLSLATKRATKHTFPCTLLTAGHKIWYIFDGIKFQPKY